MIIDEPGFTAERTRMLVSALEDLATTVNNFSDEQLREGGDLADLAASNVSQEVGGPPL
jgi:hypothetical protein